MAASDGDGAGVEETFAAVLRKVRASTIKQVSPGVQPDKTVEAMEMGFDMVRKAFSQTPPPVDKSTCDQIREGWPKFVRQMGLE